MNYRLLDQSEWSKLDQIMPTGFSPDPCSANAAIAEDENGNIVGCLFLQLTLHMEPLVLTSPKVSFDRLYNVLYDSVSENKGLHFYCFSDKEIVDRMAKHVGMKETPFKVFEQEVH